MLLRKTQAGLTPSGFYISILCMYRQDIRCRLCRCLFGLFQFDAAGRKQPTGNSCFCSSSNCCSSLASPPPPFHCICFKLVHRAQTTLQSSSAHLHLHSWHSLERAWTPYASIVRKRPFLTSLYRHPIPQVLHSRTPMTHLFLLKFLCIMSNGINPPWDVVLILVYGPSRKI